MEVEGWSSFLKDFENRIGTSISCSQVRLDMLKRVNLTLIQNDLAYERKAVQAIIRDLDSDIDTFGSKMKKFFNMIHYNFSDIKGEEDVI